MTLRDFLHLVRHSALLLVTFAIAGAAIAAAYGLFRHAEYQSISKAYVSTQGASTITDLSQGTNFTQQAVKNYADLATTPYVLQPVSRALDDGSTPFDLARQVTVSAPVDSSVLQIAVVDPSPQRAAKVANLVTDNLASAVTRLSPSGSESTQVRITQVQPAVSSVVPTGPSLAMLLVLGAAAGILAGLVTALLRDRLDTRVRTVSDVQHLGQLPVLGAIGFDPTAAERPLVVHESNQSPRAEAFRTLRTNLQYLEWQEGSRAMVVTSSIESEGKSTSAVNLALAIADAGQSVVIVDADLRRPKISTYFGIDGTVGLTDVIVGTVALEDALQTWGDSGLVVLPSGPVPPNPSELLQSGRMSGVLDTLRARYDVVILDAPPLLPVPDAAIIAKATSGAVIVAAADRVRRPQLRTALSTLDQVNATVLGVVVTMLPRKAQGTYGYNYGYGYGSYSAPAPNTPESAAGV